MSARADIFTSLRRSLGVTGSEAPRVAVVDDRIERAPKGIIPQRGQLAGEDRIGLFIRMAEGAQASVSRVATADMVPGAVAQYLRGHNLPASLRVGSDPRLAAMPWSQTSIGISNGPSDGSDLNAVSHAIAGVAETGTLVMASGPDNPTTLNFLPDNHIIVVDAHDIVGDYEEMWRAIRFAYGKGQMPRTVNWITGPSRSADIEQTLLLGAHGPRSLHIVLVG